MPLTPEQRQTQINSWLEQAAGAGYTPEQLTTLRSVAEANPEFIVQTTLAQSEASRRMAAAQTMEQAATARINQWQTWYQTESPKVEAAQREAATARAQAASIAAYAQLDEEDLTKALGYVPNGGASPGVGQSNGGFQPNQPFQPRNPVNGQYQPAQQQQQQPNGNGGGQPAFDQAAMMNLINQSQMQAFDAVAAMQETAAEHFRLFGQPLTNVNAIKDFAVQNGLSYKDAHRQMHNVSAREAEIQTQTKLAERETIRQEILSEQALTKNPANPIPQFHEATVLQQFAPTLPVNADGTAQQGERGGHHDRTAIATSKYLEMKRQTASSAMPQS